MKNFNLIAFIAAFAAIALLSSCGGAKKVTSNMASGTEDRARQLEAEGWKIAGNYSTFTLYDVLKIHNAKIMNEGERYDAINGVGKAPDKATARYAALSNAATTYATQAGSDVEGYINNQFSNLEGTSGDKIVGAYVQRVQKYIVPLLKESFAIYRVPDAKKSTIEYEVFYLLDKVKAKELKARAMTETLKEVASEQVTSEGIRDHVDKMLAQ